MVRNCQPAGDRCENRPLERASLHVQFHAMRTAANAPARSYGRYRVPIASRDVDSAGRKKASQHRRDAASSDSLSHETHLHAVLPPLRPPLRRNRPHARHLAWLALRAAANVTQQKRQHLSKPASTSHSTWPHAERTVGEVSRRASTEQVRTRTCTCTPHEPTTPRARRRTAHMREQARVRAGTTQASFGRHQDSELSRRGVHAHRAPSSKVHVPIIDARGTPERARFLPRGFPRCSHARAVALFGARSRGALGASRTSSRSVVRACAISAP